MPGIDYARLREMVAIEQVLRLSGFVEVETLGDQRRGPCPIHGSASPESRWFSVNVRKNTFQCFKCGASGNQLDLWMAISKLPVYEATLDLCTRLNLKAPEIRQQQPHR